MILLYPLFSHACTIFDRAKVGHFLGWGGLVSSVNNIEARRWRFFEGSNFCPIATTLRSLKLINGSTTNHASWRAHDVCGRWPADEAFRLPEQEKINFSIHFLLRAYKQTNWLVQVMSEWINSKLGQTNNYCSSGRLFLSSVVFQLKKTTLHLFEFNDALRKRLNLKHTSYQSHSNRSLAESIAECFGWSVCVARSWSWNYANRPTCG